MYITMDTVLNFGIHEDKRVADLMEDHPDYIKFLVDKTSHEFDEEVLEAVARL